jgi:hypothetical protein
MDWAEFDKWLIGWSTGRTMSDNIIDLGHR